MKVIKGNKELDIDKKDLENILSKYKKVVIDIGTGDGRFVYKKALENKNVFYIGIDPSAKQLNKFSKKAVRKKLNNILFVIGSIELLPYELKNTADKIYVIFPWGSLLKSVTRVNSSTLLDIKSLLKLKGEIEIVFGYDKTLEPSETERLDLPPLTKDYLKNILIPAFEKNNFQLKEIKEIETQDMKNIQSTWAKKLSFTKSRLVYRLIFKYVFQNNP